MHHPKFHTIGILTEYRIFYLNFNQIDSKKLYDQIFVN